MQPIVEPDGSISGIFIQGHEVTEQVLVKEELQTANEELQRFAYIVSHDLRAPLVNVMGFTGELDAIRKILERDLDEAEKARHPVRAEVKEAIRDDLPEAVRFIRSSTTKMDRLIGAILQLSREGQRVLTPELIQMGDLLRSYGQSLAHQLEQRRAELVIESAPDLVGDRVATEQIFGNLIENAVKYLSSGRPGRVVVRGRESGSQVVFEIEDNGRGIEAADLERIFELFRRAGAQEQPGDGIGLAHVRALVRRLGGTIAVASKVNEGTTFTVTLPRTVKLA
jgi:signal transduction histidine kinase